MRLLGPLAFVCAIGTAAFAKTRTGHDNGQAVRVKLAECGGQRAEVRTAKAFRTMAAAARKAGLDLAVKSGYRSYDEQQKLYARYRHGGNLAAPPGFSKHESGRALDIVITDYKVFEWLKTHAARYGFHRTVAREPWHWEYLGDEVVARPKQRAPRHTS
jgi:LAS superfamily LD-carboxypeptidase LdcB